MVHQSRLRLAARSKGFHLITEEVIRAIGPLPEKGLLHVFIQHTSAGLSINENADPTVRRDLDFSFDQIVPESDAYLHQDEGKDDLPAHVKSTLTGSSLSIPIQNSKLALGQWQGIYLCEFRLEARSRNLIVTVFA